MRNLCISIVSSSSLRWFLNLAIGPLLERRVELASSFTSIKQIREASTLLKFGLSPYTGMLILMVCQC